MISDSSKDQALEIKKIFTKKQNNRIFSVDFSRKTTKMKELYNYQTYNNDMNKTEITSKRIEYIDLMKGICIILIILLHNQIHLPNDDINDI